MRLQVHHGAGPYSEPRRPPLALYTSTRTGNFRLNRLFDAGFALEAEIEVSAPEGRYLTFTPAHEAYQCP